MRTRIIASVAAAFVAGAIGQISFAASLPDGTVIASVQQSEADGDNGRRTLAPTAPVYSGDRIITGRIGEAQLSFRDGTKLVVGPNSSMVLDAFVFNPDNTAREVTINVAKGAFRFITGNGPKDAYTINTPTATISVRGTEFDFDVETGATRVATYGGTTITCDRNPDPRLRNCLTQNANCTVSITQNGRPPRQLTGKDEREADLRFYFPYVVSQRTLLPQFQVNVDSCDLSGIDPIVPLQNPTNPTDLVIPIVITPGTPPPLPPPPPSDDRCPGNCGIGQGNGGGNGTGNEGNGKGPNK